MKISKQLRILAICFLLVVSVHLGFVYFTQFAFDNDSDVAKHMAIAREATQRLVMLEIAGQESDKLITKLDKLNNSLINGNKELNLPNKTNKDFFVEMQKVNNAWIEIEETILKLRQDSNYVEELIRESEDYYEATNDTIFAAEDYYQDQDEQLKLIELIIFAIELIILAIALVNLENEK